MIHYTPGCKSLLLPLSNAGYIILTMLIVIFLVLPVFASETTKIPAADSDDDSSSGSVLVDAETNEEVAGIIDTLRVFTYNIRHGRGLDDQIDLRRIADVIREKDPHLVTLQEVDVGVERSCRFDIMQILSGYLDMEPIFNENIPHQGGSYGNGILSALPVLSERNLHFIQPEGGEQRGLLTAEVEFHEVRIVLMSTHLDNRREENRKVSVEQIIETKRAYRGAPIIATGDFNAIPGSPTHIRMKEYFDDVWEKVGEGDGYTFHAANPTRIIDFFFYTNNLVEDGNARLRVVKMEVIESDASDHFPIYAEFELIR